MSESAIQPKAPEIASLSRTVPVRTETAIIMQGGAMRAIFGTGVLHEFGERGFYPDTIAAASASVPPAAYYTARQWQWMRDVWINEIGTKRVLRYDHLFRGKPIYDIEHLIRNVFKKNYPIDIETLEASRTRLVFPLYNYIEDRIEIKTSKDADFRQHVWDFMHLAMVLHPDQLLRGTKFEKYIDGAIDPFALYREPIVAPDTRIISIWNEHEFGMHLAKRIGQVIFVLLQMRGAPAGVKRMLKTRDRLIADGMQVYEEFCRRRNPLVIKPDRLSMLDGVDAISRNSNHLERLFEHGRQKAREAFESGAMDRYLQ